MQNGYEYLVSVARTKVPDERNEDVRAKFTNPVSKGDIIYWDHDKGSSGGLVKAVEHHPTISVLVVNEL